jgi:hypothetical protein
LRTASTRRRRSVRPAQLSAPDARCQQECDVRLSVGNAGTRLVIWDKVPSRCSIRLLLIAIAIAVCMVGIRVGPNDWRSSDAGGRNSVELSSPASHAVIAVRVTQLKVGRGNFVPLALPVGRVSFGVAEASPRAIALEPPNAYRDALSTLPLAPRAPPVA